VPGTIGARQVGQVRRNPHATQNFASGRFGVAQFEQITAARLYPHALSTATAPTRGPARGSPTVSGSSATCFISEAVGHPGLPLITLAERQLSEAV
jgi:hypothetical protein